MNLRIYQEPIEAEPSAVRVCITRKPGKRRSGYGPCGFLNEERIQKKQKQKETNEMV